MVIGNLTGIGKQAETLEQQRCSAGLTEGIHGQLIYISGVNIFLSVTAFLGNALILSALRKESSLHPPSKLLFRCLATTDLCVGILAEPLYVIHQISMAHEKWELCRYVLLTTFIVGYILCPVTLLTMTAISVDRLLALLLGMRYRQVVTLKRTYAAVITFWVVSFAAATSYLVNHQITIWYGRIVIPFSVITSIISYLKIFLALRHHQTQVRDRFQVRDHFQQQQQQQQQQSQTIVLNIARYKKAVSSALWLQLILVACYLPYGIVGVFGFSNLSSSRVLALNVTTTFVYLNSSLNPFLYCWKIGEVKQAVKQTIRDALCCFSS